MRFVINILIATMLLGILAGVMVHRSSSQQQLAQLELLREETRRFQRVIMLKATLRKVELSEFGYPLTIDPAWFEDNLPRHTLLSAAHPWVEIAHEEHATLEHPTEKIAASSSQSRFWYNPYTGRLRARVPASTSDAAALKMYNFINDSNLATLFADDPGNVLLDGR